MTTVHGLAGDGEKGEGEGIERRTITGNIGPRLSHYHSVDIDAFALGVTKKARPVDGDGVAL